MSPPTSPSPNFKSANGPEKESIDVAPISPAQRISFAVIPLFASLLGTFCEADAEVEIIILVWPTGVIVSTFGGLVGALLLNFSLAEEVIVAAGELSTPKQRSSVAASVVAIKGFLTFIFFLSLYRDQFDREKRKDKVKKKSRLFLIHNLLIKDYYLMNYYSGY